MDDNTERPRCHAKARSTGEQCRRRPIPGASVCRTHGGGSPKVQRAAARRVAEAEALAELAKMKIRPVTDPLTELSMLAGEAKAWKELLRSRVAELETLGYSGAAGEQIRAQVQLYAAALDRLEHVLVAIARLNLDERLVKIDEQRAELIAEAIHSMLAELGLSKDQAARAPAAVSRAMLRLVS